MKAYKQFNCLLPVEVITKLKGFAAFSNVSMRVFVTRILREKIKMIEEGEDKIIKIEKREKE